MTQLTSQPPRKTNYIDTPPFFTGEFAFPEGCPALSELDNCTVFMAVGTSGVVEPAASFVAHVCGRARTIYVGPEEPANRFAFNECHLGKAGEVLPDLLGVL